MANNTFIPFASGSTANVLSDSDYAAAIASGDLTTGFVQGLAKSAEVNKPIRQSTLMAAVLGQIIADNGTDAADSMTVAALESALLVALSPRSITQSNTAGNFTVPSGIYRIRMRIRGGGAGGGAGGGSSGENIGAGGGGGAGGYLEIMVPVAPGNSVSWVIGAGGSAGVNGGASGGQGGDTILYVNSTEVARARGGYGGINSTAGAVGQGGSGGGVAVTYSTGYLEYVGAGGSYGISFGGTGSGQGGFGGASFGFGLGTSTGPNSVGQNGGIGSGGSGGTGTSSGGSGGNGELIYDY